MLEDLAATILQRLLGRYVHGLEARNLRVAVWSGRVVLENLVLRPEALSGLLPVHVREGFIGRIEMVVPWHKLKSLPVTIELKHVLVLAEPLNQRAWTDDDEKAHQLAKKRVQLRAHKRALQRFVDNLKGRQPDLEGELVPLLSRIIDNVQLAISSLHVRYEDVTNVPSGSTCALGLRLGMLRIKSADQQGRARFVERTPVWSARCALMTPRGRSSLSCTSYSATILTTDDTSVELRANRCASCSRSRICLSIWTSTAR